MLPLIYTTVWGYHVPKAYTALGKSIALFICCEVTPFRSCEICWNPHITYLYSLLYLNSGYIKMSLKIIAKSYNKYVLTRVHILKGQILIKSNFPDSVEIKNHTYYSCPHVVKY